MPTKVKGTTGVDKVEAGAVITNPEFSGNATVTGTLTVNSTASINGSNLPQQFGFRNLIINGDMRIAQRGTSVSGITTSAYYTVDRFYFFEGTNGTYTMTQDTDVPTGQGFSNSVKINTTTTDTSITGVESLRLRHHIEGQNLQHLKYGTSSAESITLSFWVKSNLTGNAVARILQSYSGGNDQIGSLVTINSADTWEKQTITFIGNTSNAIINDNSSGFVVEVYFSAGPDISSGTLPSTWTTYALADVAVGQTINLASSTSNYINITGVQLEVGEGASDFEYRPWHIEKYLCERYCQTTYPYGTAPGTNIGFGGCIGRTGLSGVTTTGETYLSTQFKQQMRASPTILFYDVQGNVGKVTGTQFLISDYHNITASVGQSSTNGFGLTQNGGGTFGGISYHYLVTAEL